MDGYYVVGVTAIPYLGSGELINSVSKEDIVCQSQLVTYYTAHALTL